MSRSDFWMPTMCDAYGSWDLVRSAHCPSAMVDDEGTLFTASVTGINFEGHLELRGNTWFFVPDYDRCKGIEIRLLKVLPDHSLKLGYFCPYIKVFGSNYGVDINFPKVPNTTEYNHEYLFKNVIHHAFAPSLLQEIGGKFSDIAMLLVIPPGRWMNASKDNEGIMYQDFDKETLSPCKTNSRYNLFSPSKYNGTIYYRTDILRPRRWRDTQNFAPHMGEFYGWRYGESLGFAFLTWPTYEAAYDPSKQDVMNTMYQYHNSGTADPHVTLVRRRILGDANRVFRRFILLDGCVYGLIADMGYDVGLYKGTIPTASNTGTIKSVRYFTFRCIEGKSIWGESPYDHDFCLIKADDGQLIAGLVGFGGLGYNTLLTRDKDDWVHSEKYTEYDTSNNMLMFVSFAIPGSGYGSDSYTKAGVQNILLDTGVKCGVNDAVSIWNKTATDDKRLFLNTHKICTYKSPKTGLDYLFYCYCYPGKSKQLYLGYAPYYIDKNDNYNVVLLTKTEFRDKEGNSFGTFTSCSRIISMDCRNGQLWITWMNKDNSMYSVFHIKAEDLIGD